MKKTVFIFSLLNWESKLLHRSHMLAKYFLRKKFHVYYVQKENIKTLKQLNFKPKYYKDGEINIISLPAFPYLKGKSKAIFSLNDYIFKRQLKDIFACVENPLILMESPYWIEAIDKSRNHKGILCYDISDDLSQFATNEKWKNIFLSYEDKAVEQSQFIFITAAELKSKAKDKKNVYLIENGVDLDEFSDAQNILKSHFQGPICGFIGGIFEWVDFELIDKVAQYYSQYNFVLIGPTDRLDKVDKLCKHKNVYYLGEKDKKEIGNYFASLDVGLIPFVSEERYPRLKTVNSNKIFQYSYFGYPILSTSFEQVKKLKNIVEVGNNEEEFIKKLGGCVKEKDALKEKARKDYAEENAWKKRVEKMIQVVYKHEG